MILASALLASLVLNDFAFPGILCMLGLLGLRRRFIWTIQPQRRILKSLLYLLLLVIFAIHYRFGDLAGLGRFNPTAEMAWQTIARYFLATMILVLYLGSSHVLPPALALFHLAFCISAGQILLLDGQITGYRSLELGAIVLTVLYIVTSQPAGATAEPRLPVRSYRALAAFATLLLVTINVGWIVSSIMYQHQGSINILSGMLWGERLETSATNEDLTTVGFSTSGKISNVLLMIDDPDQEPLLTISADETPGYLRARAFEMYRDNEWITYNTREPVYPMSDRISEHVPLPGMNRVFRVTDREASQWKRLHVEPNIKETRVMFTPMGVGYIEMATTQLRRDASDILYSVSRTLRPYTLAYAKSGYWKAPHKSLRRRMLNTPAKLDPRIQALAAQITAGRATAREKIQAVISHFRNNYTYLLGMDTPPNQDPVTYFLLEGSTGYCEYFATGAALLLRLSDVPTRYVTGFLVTERDAEENTWIARNAHAHAWVEAWDEENDEWVLVEATVEDNLNELDQDGMLGTRSRLEEYMRKLTQVFYEYGFLGATLWSLRQVGWIPWSLLIGMGGFLWMYRRRRRRHNRFAEGPLYRLRRALNRVDRRVRRLGFRRQPSETLHAFAHRLATQAENKGTVLPDCISWYRRYAGLRYQRDMAPAEVETLVKLAWVRRQGPNH
jgi:transglutaminase-like putative cysteine protease